MTIATANDSFTYKSPRGDTERPADLVGAIPWVGGAQQASTNPAPVVKIGRAHV